MTSGCSPEPDFQGGHQGLDPDRSRCVGPVGLPEHDSSPELITRLAESYTGRSAVDFIYNDWASAYRDALHASFLDRIERALTADTRVGAFDRAHSTGRLQSPNWPSRLTPTPKDRTVSAPSVSTNGSKRGGRGAVLTLRRRDA